MSLVCFQELFPTPSHKYPSPIPPTPLSKSEMALELVLWSATVLILGSTNKLRGGNDSMTGNTWWVHWLNKEDLQRSTIHFFNLGIFYRIGSNGIGWSGALFLTRHPHLSSPFFTIQRIKSFVSGFFTDALSIQEMKPFVWELYFPGSFKDWEPHSPANLHPSPDSTEDNNNDLNPCFQAEFLVHQGIL